MKIYLLLSKSFVKRNNACCMDISTFKSAAHQYLTITLICDTFALCEYLHGRMDNKEYRSM